MCLKRNTIPVCLAGSVVAEGLKWKARTIVPRRRGEVIVRDPWRAEST